MTTADSAAHASWAAIDAPGFILSAAALISAWEKLCAFSGLVIARPSVSCTAIAVAPSVSAV
ncbi:hypothetical protein ACFYT3_11755 [Nocardia amikacinitolerans]|uniref:hypothetical protein n=1 Tax=Nocardia amikacinitolerans TaxID=756689 RepID=UPI0020A52698|nr:hypothetical protein [Nocardia amikacinitolerans]